MLGIRSSYEVVPSKTSTRVRNKFSIEDSLSRSPTFLTNATIRRILHDANLLSGHALGSFSAKIEGETLYWKSYRPFGHHSSDEHVLKGKVIASVLELMFLLRVKREFPGVSKVVHSREFGSGRIRQLRRRKLPLTHPLSAAISSLRRVVAEYSRLVRVNRPSLHSLPRRAPPARSYSFSPRRPSPIR